MKQHNKNIIKALFFLLTFNTFAQSEALYLRLNRSIQLRQDTLFQPIKFKEADIIYNKIIDFHEEKIQIKKSGIYEINGFVNINPGVFGIFKDLIEIEVYLYKNRTEEDEQLLHVAKHTYTYGNFNVARSFLFPPKSHYFEKEDEISIWLKILPTSTISINTNKNYHHVITPTGMPQIAALRLMYLGE
ncbi:hypothetical protein AB4865_03665 [Capnocytophaga sp. ARDL2]|uniref:hypothetical protein n=1 Tax=Capnocytophaga sp. ARDL2 TaxID=3238809 RepID=UPI0035590031